LCYKPVKQCYFIVFKIVSKEILRVMVKTQHLRVYLGAWHCPWTKVSNA